MKNFKTFSKEKSMDDFEEDVLPTHPSKEKKDEKKVEETNKEKEEANENI